MTIKDKFDINVFNRGAYESAVLPEDQWYDEWMLCPYTLVDLNGGWGTGKELNDLNLVLTDQDIKAMRFDTSEDDTWVESTEFIKYYDGLITPRVQEWIDNVLAIL